MSPKPNDAISMKPALRFVSLLAGLGCFLSGCAMVGPDYKPPTAKVATQWLEFEDPRLKATSPVEPLWWKQAFQDPVLDQLVAEALADNLTLRSAALRVLQARQRLLIAKGNLFPQEQYIGASAAVVDPGAGAGASGVYGLNFNANWEIDVWGQNPAPDRVGLGGLRRHPLQLTTESRCRSSARWHRPTCSFAPPNSASPWPGRTSPTRRRVSASARPSWMPAKSAPSTSNRARRFSPTPGPRLRSSSSRCSSSRSRSPFCSANCLKTCRAR